MDRLAEALAYLESGLSMTPIGAGSKTSAIPWKDYQSRKPTAEEITNWVKTHAGLAIICGAISGDLEVLDIETDAPVKEFARRVNERDPDLLQQLPRIETPSGGRHILYRCRVIEGNQKLAADSNGKTWIETRGKGGYVLSPLCLPETHPSGKPYKVRAGDPTKIPTITPEEREILLSAARSLNQHIEHRKIVGYREIAHGNGFKPGEDFNNRADVCERVRELMREQGWSKFRNGTVGELWSRPGVTDHSSATLFSNGILYPFSTNAVPFSANEAYSPFAVFAFLRHGGDFTAAARALGQDGYGTNDRGDPQSKPSHSEVDKDAARLAQFKFTTLTSLLNEPKELIAYVVTMMLPCGGFSIICSKPKVGKSTVARALAVAVSLGNPFFGRATKQGKTIYLCLEEKRAEVAECFRRMGANTDNIIIHTGSTPKDAVTALEAAIDEHSPVLVIIDPLSRFVRVTDFNSYAETTRALEPLIDLARLSKCQTHIMALHHNGKGGDLREAGDAVMGSTGIFAAVDTLLTMRKREKVRTIESTQRYGEDLPETIVHLDPITGNVEAVGDMKTFALNERKAAVLEVIGGDPITELAIKEQITGTNSGLTSQAIRALFDDGVLQRSGKGRKGDPFCYWRAKTISDRDSEDPTNFEDFEIDLREAAYA